MSESENITRGSTTNQKSLSPSLPRSLPHSLPHSWENLSDANLVLVRRLGEHEAGTGTTSRLLGTGGSETGRGRMEGARRRMRALVILAAAALAAGMRSVTVVARLPCRV